MNANELSVIAAGLVMYRYGRRQESDDALYVNLLSDPTDEVYCFMLMNKDISTNEYSFFRYDTRSLVEGNNNVFIDYGSGSIYFVIRYWFNRVLVMNSKTKERYLASLQGMRLCNVTRMSDNTSIDFKVDYHYVELSETV